MTFWAGVLTILGTVWAFTLMVALIGAGVPVLREKIRKKRRTGK